MPTSLAQLRDAIQFRLGNLAGFDPLTSVIDEKISEAQREIVRRALKIDPENEGAFPELRTRWKMLSNGTVTEFVPVGLLTAFDVRVYEQATSPVPGDESRRLEECATIEEFEDLDQSKTGYPQRWIRERGVVRVWPLPSASYTSWLEIRGISLPAPMAVDADLLTLDDHWKPAVIDFASYLVAKEAGWAEEAAFWLSACDQKIATTPSIDTLERKHDLFSVRVKGLPSLFGGR